MKDKLTPWFPASAKPVRNGVYQREYSFLTMPYSYWNGVYWCSSNDTPSGAGQTHLHAEKSIEQRLSWRGLAENPAKKGKK